MDEHAVEDPTSTFTSLRPQLLSVAYRLTGSWADAEDAVSEAWPRWQRHAGEVQRPVAWLTRVVSRIALDRLRSAQVRRETYVGPWLPEPLIGAADDPADQVVVHESARLAFVAVLETLSPEQRVAVVLHDTLDLSFADVAQVLGCSEPTARQHASRGRRRLDAARQDGRLPPPRPPADEAWPVVGALLAALQAGDAARMAQLLAPDVVFVSDGAGKVTAATRPMRGADAVGRFMHGLVTRYGDVPYSTEPVLVNGDPGVVLRFYSQHPRHPTVAVYAFTVADGRLLAVHAVLAPDKLGSLAHLPLGTGQVAGRAGTEALGGEAERAVEP